MELEYIKKYIINHLETFSRHTPSSGNWIKHPLRVIQATKSLIGININQPPIKLIEWVDNYCSDINIQKNKNNHKNIELFEVVSLKQLDEAILNKDIQLSRIITGNLVRVSDGRPIIEHMLELSMRQEGISFLMVKSILRSNLFMQNSHIKELLNLCVNVLVDFDLSNTNLINNSKIHNNKKRLEILLHLVAIKNEEMIRDKFYNSLFPTIDNKFKKIIADIGATPGPINLVDNGRKVLLEYICNLDKKKITPELILFFDALRGVIFMDRNFDKKILSNLANYYIGDIAC